MFSFTLILAGLRAVIAVAAARDRTQAAFWVALHTRIGRMGQRLERLIARWRAGTLPAPRASRAGEACASRALPALRFPTSKGWVRARLGYDISGYASQLQHQLNDAECQAFLAACPAARRILRPLLRMISPDPPPQMIRVVRPVAAVVAAMVGIVAAPVSQILDA